MYGQEIPRQKDFMRKWECGQKKDRWNTSYDVSVKRYFAEVRRTLNQEEIWEIWKFSS